MIEIMERSAGNALGFRANGKLSHTDYQEALVPALEKAIAEHGNVRMLLFMDRDFHGWEAAAAWDDTKLGISHRREFERCALVGGPDWVRWSAKLFGLLLPGAVRCFDANELEEAWAWLEAPE